MTFGPDLEPTSIAQTHVEIRRRPRPNQDVFPVGRETALSDFHGVASLGQLDGQSRRVRRSGPPFAVDENLGVGRLHANRERAEAAARLISGRSIRARPAAPLLTRIVPSVRISAASRVTVSAERALGDGRGSMVSPGASGSKLMPNRLTRRQDSNRGSAERPVAVEVHGNLVTARLQPEPLEHAVEVVDDTRRVAVHEDFRFARRHLEAERRS